WHPTADEWQYVFDGKVSVTLFGANGRYRIETLEKGDVGYIPQGYGHSLENVGDKPCRVLIGFNTGIYEDIDLTDGQATRTRTHPTSWPTTAARRQPCSRSSRPETRSSRTRTGNRTGPPFGTPPNERARNVRVGGTSESRRCRNGLSPCTGAVQAPTSCRN